MILNKIKSQLTARDLIFSLKYELNPGLMFDVHQNPLQKTRLK